jgi:hypothetical protein
MFITVTDQFRVAGTQHGWVIQKLTNEWRPILNYTSLLGAEKDLKRKDKHAIAPGGLTVPDALHQMALEIERLADIANELPDPQPAPDFSLQVGFWRITADRRQFIVQNASGRSRTFHRHLRDAVRSLAAERARLVEGEFPACLPQLDSLADELKRATLRLLQESVAAHAAI